MASTDTVQYVRYVIDEECVALDGSWKGKGGTAQRARRAFARSPPAARALRRPHPPSLAVRSSAILLALVAGATADYLKTTTTTSTTCSGTTLMTSYSNVAGCYLITSGYYGQLTCTNTSYGVMNIYTSSSCSGTAASSSAVTSSPYGCTSTGFSGSFLSCVSGNYSAPTTGIVQCAWKDTSEEWGPAHASHPARNTDSLHPAHPVFDPQRLTLLRQRAPSPRRRCHSLSSSTRLTPAFRIPRPRSRSRLPTRRRSS